jgi:hypothetical protein
MFHSSLLNSSWRFHSSTVKFAVFSDIIGSTYAIRQHAVSDRQAGNQPWPEKLYPDPTMTPGTAGTVSADDLMAEWECPTALDKDSCTYSQSHRAVSKATHTKVYDEYAVKQADRNIKHGEVDHFDPLCNGGSNDLQNLWYQPVTNKWNGKNYGFHEKDALETWVCAEEKAGRLDPKEAFQKITSDWVAYYNEVKPKKSKHTD